jgi:DNA repair protein RadC
MMNKKWKHPGGKLVELGAGKLTDTELLSIIISSGTKGKSAELIAEEIMNKYDGFKGLAGQSSDGLLKIKGLGLVKIVRIAAFMEIAKRIVDDVLKNYEPEKQ